VAIAALALTVAGLCAKEAAITIPPLLAVAWWFDRARRPAWFAAMLGAGTACALYLGLRHEALLQAPREGAQYALSLAHPPLRWIEYQLFAQIPTVPETFSTLARGVDVRIALAAGLWLALCAALWKARAWLLGLFLIGGAMALFAVLPLGSSWNHYGYAYGALAAMVVAAAWPTAPRWGRGVIATMALLSLAHGAVLMLMFQHVGRVQATFSPALAEAVAGAATHPVRLRIAPEARAWIFQRLTHDIPRYRGVPIGARVVLVPAEAPADYTVEADGWLVPVR
jgi:predicted secreted protein